MPTIDMSLKELQQYKGRNPRPADFDQYWELALKEMRAVDPQVELVRSSFQVPNAECFDLYFTGVRGARIHSKYIRPNHSVEPHPAIIHFHGYRRHSGDWYDKLGYATLGYSVFSMDCRGQGGLSDDPGGVKGNTHEGHIIRGLDDDEHQLLFRHIFLDAAQIAGIAMSMPEVDESHIMTTGGSQGGALSLACAALEPRIRKLSLFNPFLSDYKRVWEMDLAQGAYAELRTFFRLFDPQHKREDEIFTRLGYIDLQHLANRICGEVLFGIGLMDTTCPPSAQFAIYNKITSPKQMVIYPDFAHEELPGFADQQIQFLREL